VAENGTGKDEVEEGSKDVERRGRKRWRKGKCKNRCLAEEGTGKDKAKESEGEKMKQRKRAGKDGAEKSAGMI
jgi:hypothetical protein